jgi:ABC-type lipoprotein export system ATPase subunit
LNEELRITFLIATHNLKLARSMHRWLRLTDGKVEAMHETGISIASLPMV